MVNSMKYPLFLGKGRESSHHTCMLVPFVTRQTLKVPSRLVFGPFEYLKGCMGRHSPSVLAYGGI